MNLMTGLIGGVIGAAIGATLWGAVSYFTGYEVGWIAWAIGALAGTGVAIGTGRLGGLPAGAIAVVLSLLGIGVGKWVGTELAWNEHFNSDETGISALADNLEEEYRAAGKPLPPHSSSDNEDHISSAYAPSIWKQAEREWSMLSPEQQEEIRKYPPASYSECMVSCIADLIVEEQMQDDQQIEWPAGMDLESAWHKAHYPAPIWSDAEARWNAMSKEQQQEFRQQTIAAGSEDYQRAVAEFRKDVGFDAFLASFSAFDLLWVILAVGSAYQIAARTTVTGQSNEQPRRL